IHKRWRRPMDRIVLFRLNRSALIDRVSSHVEHPAHDAFADRHGYRTAAISNLEAPFEALGARHGDRPDPLVAEVLLHFERGFGGLVLNRVLDAQGVRDPRQRLRKYNVNHLTETLNNLSLVTILPRC